eukprot:gene2142-369_t
MPPKAVLPLPIGDAVVDAVFEAVATSLRATPTKTRPMSTLRARVAWKPHRTRLQTAGHGVLEMPDFVARHPRLKLNDGI